MQSVAMLEWMNTMSSIDSMKLAVRRESNPRWNESFQLKANDRVYVAIQDAKYAVSSSKRSFYDFHGGTLAASVKRAGKYLYVRYLINETWNTASIYSIIRVLSYFFFSF